MTLKAFLTSFLCMTAAVAVVAGGVRIALANEGDESKRLAEAEAACLAGSYDRGAQLLAELYLATRHPAYLHNQGRCYEQNGRYELASLRYREFVAKARALSPKQRADEGLTEERIAKIEAQLSKVDALAQAQRARSSSASPAEGADNDVSLGAAAASSRTTPGRGLRVAGVSTMAVGGAALVSGVVAGLIMRNAHQEVVDAANNRREYPRETYEQGQRAATVATVSFVAAPVLIGVGVVLFWMGRTDSDSAGRAQAARRRLGFAPVLACDRMGGVFSMRF